MQTIVDRNEIIDEIRRNTREAKAEIDRLGVEIRLLIAQLGEIIDRNQK